jgi:hypothetical protein
MNMNVICSDFDSLLDCNSSVNSKYLQVHQIGSKNEVISFIQYCVLFVSFVLHQPQHCPMLGMGETCVQYIEN